MGFFDKLIKNLERNGKEALLQTIVSDRDQTISGLIAQLNDQAHPERKFMNDSFMNLTIGEIVDFANRENPPPQLRKADKAVKKEELEDEDEDEDEDDLEGEEGVEEDEDEDEDEDEEDEEEGEGEKEGEEKKEKVTKKRSGKKPPPKPSKEEEEDEGEGEDEDGEEEDASELEGIIMDTLESRNASSAESGMSFVELREAIDEDESELKKTIKAMLGSGLIESIGKTRGTKYFIS